MNHPQPSSKHLQELAFKEVPSPDLSKVAPASTETSPAFFPEHAKTQDQGEEEYAEYSQQVVPQIDPSVPQPVVQSQRRPLILRHYAKQALTPRSLNVKLGLRHNYHKGRAAIRHYANQPACPF